MAKKLESTPVPGPFFRWASEAEWVTAAKAAGFYTNVKDIDKEEEQREVLMKKTNKELKSMLSGVEKISNLNKKQLVELILEGEVTTKEVLNAYTHDHSIDVVGDIYEGGEWEDQEDGTVKEIKAPTKLPGYHINYLGTLPKDWDKQEVKPEKPHRVFA